MKRFCQYCGKELNEHQDVCLGCGKNVLNERTEIILKKPKNHNTYFNVSGIIMIILCFCLFAANGSSSGDTNMIFGFPALFGLIGAICTLAGKNSKYTEIVAGVLYIIGALINFIGILDISIFAILCILFAILNIVYATKMD